MSNGPPNGPWHVVATVTTPADVEAIVQPAKTGNDTAQFAAAKAAAVALLTGAPVELTIIWTGQAYPTATVRTDVAYTAGAVAWHGRCKCDNARPPRELDLLNVPGADPAQLAAAKACATSLIQSNTIGNAVKHPWTVSLTGGPTGVEVEVSSPVKGK